MYNPSPRRSGVHVSKCTAGVPPARGRPAGREDEGGRDARGTLWATHLLTCTLVPLRLWSELGIATARSMLPDFWKHPARRGV